MKRVFHTSKTWTDFQSKLRQMSPNEQGDCFEVLTEYYLRIEPKYATKLKNVWRLKEVPRKTRRHLNLPGEDEGIDLIAQTEEGEYWAIQSKYPTDETRSLARRELSTFTDLAFGVCRNISLGLVCTTAERFSRKLRLYGDRLEFCAGDAWRSLRPDFFRQLRRLIAGKPTELKAKRPRKHQRRAIRNAVKHFSADGNARGKLISPCGTGKSLTGYWIAEALKARTVLVAVPSLALIKQSLDVWATEAVAYRRQLNWICVCSDEGVARTERDDAVVLVQDLGVRVHTSPTEIAGWLRGSKRGKSVVFTTYHSGEAIAEAARLTRTTFDVGILDEAHHTAGRKDRLFSLLLHEKNIPIKKRVFITATERRYAGRSEHIISMDDPDTFGETFEMLSFKHALECQPPILSDYRIITMVVTREEIADLVKRNVFVKPDKGQWSQDVEAEMLAAAIALRRATQSRPIKHSVSFHNSIARARAFMATQDAISAAYPRYKSLRTFHVSGAIPTAVRSRRLEEFENAKRALITNARCLSEGVDVPNIDCVLFADPRRSAIDIVQAVGRALRPAPGKKCGHVVVPVLIDQEANDGQVLQDSKFDAMLQVLRALAANDERIIEYFRAIAQGSGRRSTRGPFDTDLPDGLAIDADEFASSIKLRFWSRLAKLSWRPFVEARAFVRNLGLRSTSDWHKLRRGELPRLGSLPDDIPRQPDRTYRGYGWVGWGDWLGTGTIASRLLRYRPFKEAREFARSLGLTSSTDWRRYCKGKLPGKGTLPSDIPANPNQTYKDSGWASFGDWLGTGAVATRARRYRPFEEAREFARSLGLKSGSEWRRFCTGKTPEKGRLPSDVPANPDRTYEDKGWIGMGDWLGTRRVASFARQYRPFREAREFSRTLELSGAEEWNEFCKGQMPEKGTLPADIPAAAHAVYKDEGWISWGDWLGTGKLATFKRKFRPFEEARQFARSLGLKSQSEWNRFCKGEMLEKGTLPLDIPTTPSRTYKDEGWVSLGDWLGTGAVATRARQYRPFEEARQFARSLGLRSQAEWNEFCKGKMPGKGTVPADIPTTPSRTYKDEGWVSLGDWLGTGRL